MTVAGAKDRIGWVDYAKGICIVLVVMMHSTLGVEKAVGEVSWLNSFIHWAAPFRMPDFFLISGLFLATRIDRPWRDYLDSKVLHFIYFYVLWMTIQFATKGYGIMQDQGFAGLIQGYLTGFVEPFGTLWFIYMLAIFFVVTKLTRGLPPAAVFAAAALLEMAPVHTGFLLIDEFASRYVYFFAGYWLAGAVFSFASGVDRKSTTVVLGGLFIWGAANAWMVNTGWSQVPGLGLALGFVGAAAVVSMGVLLSRTKLAEPLRYAGENSIVIYLAFFLFMAGSRAVILRLMPGLDPGVVALAVTAAGVVGPVLLYWAVRRTPLAFLFRRPGWAKLASARPEWHSAGHVKSAQPQAR